MTVTTHKNLDLITIGRAGVDLYGEQIGSRLETMSTFKKYVGGCAANIAIGSSRLGLKTALITKVGDDHMGRFILETLQKEKVNVQHIHADKNRLTALVLLAIEDKNTFPLVFYRENCADMALCEADIDISFIAQSKALLVTGTHFSSPETDRASRKAMIAARMNETKVILDIDYRPVLWGLTAKENGENRFVASHAVTEAFKSILPLCDLIVGTEEEFKIAGGAEDIVQALQNVRQRSQAILILKTGANGCKVFEDIILETLDTPHTHAGFNIEVLNVLGAGDAFISGFLYAWLNKKSLEDCCEIANACGALVVMRHGCSAEMPSLNELNLYLDKFSNESYPDKYPLFKHTHSVLNRHHTAKDLQILAFDHRTQFEAFTKEKDSARIKKAKKLIAQAMENVMASHKEANIGIIIDRDYGQDILSQWSKHNRWVATPIEKASVTPLQFDVSGELGETLRLWPKQHIIKCLVQTHPDERYATHIEQQKSLLQLYQATQSTGQALLLELIPSPAFTLTSVSLSKSMATLYEAGIYPDWWKIPAPKDQKTWDNLKETLSKHDPYCQGILLLGQNASIEQIISSFELASKQSICTGFAIGRAIFAQPVQKWFAGTINDNALIEQITYEFIKLMSAWQTHKQSALSPNISVASIGDTA